MIEIIHLCRTHNTVHAESDGFVNMNFGKVDKIVKGKNNVAVHIGDDRHLFMTYEYFKGWKIGRSYILYSNLKK